MEFYQEAPILTNTYKSDPLLKNYLKKIIPAEYFKQIDSHLESVGGKAAQDWLQWSIQAEQQEPELVAFDAWGRRIDQIQMSDSWKKLEAAAATEGLIATAYERKFGEYSRVYQAALLYLFHPSSAFVSCPLAMTDGAARAIELYGDADLKATAFLHLTSRDPKNFWTSGQWMTEKTGGSDVSETSTQAIFNKSANTLFDWQLHGIKWFTSATTSPMAMLLARTEGAEPGSRGLSLFYAETHRPDGSLNQIEILRLKDKLGTRAMPTAELKLMGTPARLVGGLGGGVRKISSLFNITRIHNSLCSVSHMRRALDLAQDYSKKRTAFGKKLIDHPLHLKTLNHLEEQFTKAFYLTFYVAHLLGKTECGTATENEIILTRALTPIAKLYTAKLCMNVTSEVVEIFGGAGYIEDTGVAKLLRDAQVFSIWEGTTNVLSLDFVRALKKENAAPILIDKINSDFSFLKNNSENYKKLIQLMNEMQKNPDSVETNARDLSWTVAEIFCEGLQKA